MRLKKPRRQHALVVPPPHAGLTMRELLRGVAAGLLTPANALLQREPPRDG
jgi:hypothetical protein